MFVQNIKHNSLEHVAIIMDGNGRWAQNKGRPRLFGHQAGARRVREIVESCPGLGVKYLTIFAFSTENWKRTQIEVSGLMKLFKRASLGSLVMVLLYPIGVLIMPETRWYEVVVTAAASVVVTLRHHENIKRLFKGEEKAIE